MTYVIAKHKKTGSERIFTEPVFRANEHQYKFIAYTENPNAKSKKIGGALANATSAATKTGTVSQLEAKVVKKETVKKPGDDVADSVLTDLQAQYKALTGKEAKKNWGVPRLTEEIKKVENPA